MTSDKKWKGCIGYDREGVEQYREFETEAEAKAYMEGANDAMTVAEHGTIDGEFNPLEDYWAIAFQGDFADER